MIGTDIANGQNSHTDAHALQFTGGTTACFLGSRFENHTTNDIVTTVPYDPNTWGQVFLTFIMTDFGNYLGRSGINRHGLSTLLTALFPCSVSGW